MSLPSRAQSSPAMTAKCVSPAKDALAPPQPLRNRLGKVPEPSSQSRLTAPVPFLISAPGTPLPTEGRLSGRIDHGESDARRVAGDTALLVRPLRQAPRLEPPGPHRRRPRA